MRACVRFPIVAITILAGSVLASGRAHADAKADADALVREGAKLAGSGKLAEAIERFKAAEAALPRVLHLCNIGVAYAKLGRPDRAQRYFTSCRLGSSTREWQTIAPSAEQVDQALAKGGYAKLALEIDPGDAQVTVSSLGDDEPFRARDFVQVWVPVGEVTVSATREGLEPHTETIRVTANLSVAFKLTATPTAVAEPTPTTAEPVPALTTTPAEETSSSGGRSPRRTWGYVTLGVGAVLIGGGIWAHLSALDRLDHAETIEEGPAFDDAKDAYHARRTLAFGLYAVGAAAAGVGTYVVLTGGTTAAVAPTDGGATVWLTGRFD